jgi:hypothetical protein
MKHAGNNRALVFFRRPERTDKNQRRLGVGLDIQQEGAPNQLQLLFLQKVRGHGSFQEDQTKHRELEICHESTK